MFQQITRHQTVCHRLLHQYEFVLILYVPKYFEGAEEVP